MKHFLIVLTCAPNRPNAYRAPCGYESTNAEEFTGYTNPSIKGVTCPACLEKLNKSIVIVAEKVWHLYT